MRTAPRLHDDAPAGEREPSRALAAGLRLRDYEVTGLIFEGGFGIVYLAWDHSLQRKVAIKEYMPAAMASRIAGSSAVVVKSDRHLDTFRAGLRSFVNEARLLARFDHPSLVKVYRFWEENGTAYMVMPFYEGPTLKSALAELGHVPTEAELRTWLKPVLNAVARLHEGGSQHLNLEPDSILLTPMGPVVLGLDAAQRALATAEGAANSALQPGYAAPEQYDPAGPACGPRADLYALAAILHRAIAGEPPPPADVRLQADTFQPLAVVAAGLYDGSFLAAIDAALALPVDQRPADDAAFRALMGDMEAPAAVAPLAPRRDPMQEPFIGDLQGPREVTVPDHPLLLPAAVPAALPAVEPKPKAPLRLPKESAQAPRPPARGDARASAEWPDTVDSGAPPSERRRRSPYGVIAVVFAVIGLGALALQYAGRQSERNAAPSGAGARPQATAVAPPAPPALRPTPGTSTAIASPSASVVALPLPTATAPAVATTAASAPAPSPTPTVLPPATATLPSATGAAPAPAPAPDPSLSAGPARPASAVNPAGPATDTERLARCTEILQKASLEPITPAETVFYKRECK